MRLPLKGSRSPSAIPQCFPDNFENETLLRIDAYCFARRNSEEQWIEQIRPWQKPPQRPFIFSGSLGIQIKIGVSVLTRSGVE